MTQAEQKNSRVLVTGVTGFVGAHVARQLLLHGYKVRGTVRNAADEAKLTKLRQEILGTDLFSGPPPELEFVEADLLKKETWPAAVAGCQYICHVASPFTLNIPSDPDVLIKPAVEGTVGVLKSALKNGEGIQRVVV